MGEIIVVAGGRVLMVCQIQRVESSWTFCREFDVKKIHELVYLLH